MTSTIRLSQLTPLDTVVNAASIFVIISDSSTGATERLSIETLNKGATANTLLHVAGIVYQDGTTQNTADIQIEQVQMAWDQSNAAIITSNTALSVANSIAGTAQSASDTANTASNLATMALTLTANTANLALITANNASNTAQLARNTANTASNNAQLAYNAANGVSGIAILAGTTANNASNTAQLAFNTANGVSNIALSASTTANASANLSLLAVSLRSGSSNQLVYQTGSNTSAFIVAPTINNSVLSWTTTGFSWNIISVNAGTNANYANIANAAISAVIAIDVFGGLANQILYQTAANATSYMVAPTVNNSFLEWTTSGFNWTTVIANNTSTNSNYANIANVALNSATSTNITAGVANQISYQSAANTTKFIIAPSTNNTSLSWNSNTGFVWSPTAISGIYLTVITGTGTSNTFALNAPASANIFYTQTFINGVYQMSSTGAYSLLSNTIIFSETPTNGSIIEITNYVK